MTRPESSCAQFGIEFGYDVDNTILLLHGELDALSVAAFSGALIALAERGTRFVTIDLSKLRFCSIGGLRAMAELAARLNAVGGGVRILGPSILTRMLDLADLRSLFTVGDPQRTAHRVSRRRAPRSGGRPSASIESTARQLASPVVDGGPRGGHFGRRPNVCVGRNLGIVATSRLRRKRCRLGARAWPIVVGSSARRGVRYGNG